MKNRKIGDLEAFRGLEFLERTDPKYLMKGRRK